MIETVELPPGQKIKTVELPPDRQRPTVEPLDARLLDDAAKSIQKAFDDLLSQDSVLLEILKKIQAANVRMAVFGGWARDRLLEVLQGKKVTSRDIDFVVETDRPIGEFFPEDARENTFGGVGIDGKVMPLEAWALHTTFLIRRNKLQAEFSSLPETADYNINAILFFPAQCNGNASLLDLGAGSALKSRSLDFMANSVAQPRLQAARAVILATKLDLQPTEVVCDFVQDVCEDGDAAKEVQVAIRTYCPPEYVSHALELLAQIRQGNLGGRPKTDYFFHCWGVFEGGGVRAAAHAGAFTAAKRAGVRFGRVAGTSGGSIVAALVAAGSTPAYLRKHLEELDFESLLDKPSESDIFFESNLPLWVRLLRRFTCGRVRKVADIATYGGLYNSERLGDWVEKCLVELVRPKEPQNKRPVFFSELPTPLYIVATDLTSGQPKVWSNETTGEESVALAVRHSCTIPFFFQPAKAGSTIFLDGGAISNLPAFVLNKLSGATGERDVLSRILAFRLVEEVSGNKPVRDLLDFGKRLSAVVIDSASEIQLQLQPNVYPIPIKTGAIRSTDFDLVDEANKRFLYGRGVRDVRAFFKAESLTATRGDATAHEFQGFDEKMLLLVRQMRSCKRHFIAMGQDTYWLDHVFPSLLLLARQEVTVTVVVSAINPSDPVNYQQESRRRRLLTLLGAKVTEQSVPILLNGFGFDLGTSQASTILTYLPDKSLNSSGYEHEKVRLYTADSDPVILDILAAQVRSHTEAAIPPGLELEYATCSEQKLFERLRLIHTYKHAKISMQRIPVSREILVMQRRIKEYKALQIRYLASDLTAEGRGLFGPLQVTLMDGKSSIVTPPVLEKHSGSLIVIEGNARLFHCFTNGIEEVDVVLIEGVTDQLPSDGRHSLGNLRLVSSTVSVLNNYDNYKQSLYRHIERDVHATYE